MEKRLRIHRQNRFGEDWNLCKFLIENNNITISNPLPQGSPQKDPTYSPGKYQGSPNKKGSSSKGEIYERSPLMKPREEKVESYSFPGQYVSTSAMQSKLLKEFSGDRPTGGSPKKAKNYIVFDPTTQEVQYTNPY